MSDKSLEENQKPIIGISIGDINGIGPEVILKTLSDQRITKQLTPVIYASGGLISFYRKQLDLQNFNYNQINNIEDIQTKKINVLNIWNERIEIVPGTPSMEAGKYARLSLESAVSDLKQQKIQALVTSPISKEHTQSEEFNFPGHTEYLANAFEAEDSLMLMVHEELRVAVATGHIPLADVKTALTPEVIESKLSMLIHSLQKDFKIKKPRIGILGLNPHAGENGLLGDDENTVIVPVLEQFREKGNLIFGPFPADGFFGSNQYMQFDGILAMYHDQGLIPFKHISQGAGVNFTAGLPGKRTSPAHGTAFNLAGKNLADPESFRNALFLAVDLVRP
ncbi:MAG: 4-hydroxythreonine-4-phosphate dehydrogenase PdxA [Cyclobacteriaceae bacterium]